MSRSAHPTDSGGSSHPDAADDPDSADAAADATGQPAALLVVGRMVKPHGLRGDLIVSLSTNRDERVAPGSVLFTADGREFRVVRSSPHQGRFIVAFEGVDGIDAAQALRGTELLAPPLEDPDALWIHQLIGSPVQGTDGTLLGTVESVEANPASDLLVLAGGGLIPLRFVVDAPPGAPVVVDIPDGLLDLA